MTGLSQSHKKVYSSKLQVHPEQGKSEELSHSTGAEEKSQLNMLWDPEWDPGPEGTFGKSRGDLSKLQTPFNDSRSALVHYL